MNNKNFVARINDLSPGEAEYIWTSIRQGLPPTGFTQLLCIGRDNEQRAIKNSIARAKRGNSSLMVITGGNGCGKTYLLDVSEELSKQKGFVVSRVTFTNNMRLFDNAQGVDANKAVATYREIVERMTSSDSRDGCLEAAVNRFIAQSCEACGSEADRLKEDQALAEKVKADIWARLSGASGDITRFATYNAVIDKYIDGITSGCDQLKVKAVDWFKARYDNVNKAEMDFGIREKVTGANWIDMLKKLSEFLVLAGFSGLVILFDEAVKLYEISNEESRRMNYNVIHQLFDSDLGHMFLVFAGTPKLVEVEKKGLYSNPHLKSRLKEFSNDNGVPNFNQSIWTLEAIDPNAMPAYTDTLAKLAQVRFAKKLPLGALTLEDQVKFLEVMEEKARKKHVRFQKSGQEVKEPQLDLREVGMQFTFTLESMYGELERIEAEGGDPSGLRFSDFFSLQAPETKPKANTNNIKYERI